MSAPNSIAQEIIAAPQGSGHREYLPGLTELLADLGCNSQPPRAFLPLPDYLQPEGFDVGVPKGAPSSDADNQRAARRAALGNEVDRALVCLAVGTADALKEVDSNLLAMFREGVAKAATEPASPQQIQIPLFSPYTRYHFTGYEPERSERPPYSNLPLAAAVQSAILQRLAGGASPQRAARQSDARSEALPAEMEAFVRDVLNLTYGLFQNIVDMTVHDFYGGEDYSTLADDVRRSLAGLSPEYLDSLLPDYQYWSPKGRAYARLRTLAQQIAVGLTVVRAHPHLHQPQRRTTSHANDLRKAA